MSVKSAFCEIVTGDTVARYLLAESGCHAAVPALVATEATLCEDRDVTSLVFVRIVTRRARHLRLSDSSRRREQIAVEENEFVAGTQSWCD